MLSFAFLFTTLVMDFFDQKYGKFYTRLICFLGMMMNVGHLIRVGGGDQPESRMYFWFAITLLFFLRKIFQLRDKVEVFEKHIESKTRILHRPMQPH